MLTGAQPKTGAKVYDQSALNQYQKINVETGVVDADPHRLIQLLLNGAMDRVSQARGALANDDYGAMGTALGKALSIIGGLQSCLDHENGGEVAANLDGLYDYMTRRLMEVHREHDDAPLREVNSLLGTIKSGWDEIREQAINAN